jgi:hypothetical protein
LKPQLVEVDWIDSCAHSGWRSFVDARDDSLPSSCRSIGYMLRRDAKVLVLAQSIDATDEGDERFADVLAIPAAVVRRVRRLK